MKDADDTPQDFHRSPMCEMEYILLQYTIELANTLKVSYWNNVACVQEICSALVFERWDLSTYAKGSQVNLSPNELERVALQIKPDEQSQWFMSSENGALEAVLEIDRKWKKEDQQSSMNRCILNHRIQFLTIMDEVINASFPMNILGLILSYYQNQSCHCSFVGGNHPMMGPGKIFYCIHCPVLVILAHHHYFDKHRKLHSVSILSRGCSDDSGEKDVILMDIAFKRTIRNECND